MWISELSERTGLPVDTIKHYLRVGVLPRGEPLGPQRADYDESHVKRLMMVRALHDVGKLSLDQMRQIFERIDQIDEIEGSGTEAISTVHQLLSSELADYREPTAGALAMVDELLESRGWDVDDANAHRRALAVALDTLVATMDSAYYRETRPASELLSLYADHLEQIARVELTMVDQGSRKEMLDSIAVGTVLLEPLLMLIRRIALRQVAREEWSLEGEPHPQG